MIRMFDFAGIPIRNPLCLGKSTKMLTCVFLDSKRLTDKQG